MKCKCGNNRFIGHQVCHHHIQVDECGDFQEDGEIYYSGNPFDPFTCTVCGTEYEELDEKGADGSYGQR